MAMTEQQVMAIFEDGEFTKSIIEMENPEDVQAALKAKGLDLSLEEVGAIAKEIAKASDTTLSDDDLEDVSGGFAITLALGVTTAMVAKAVIGGVGALFAVGSLTDHFTRRRW